MPEIIAALALWAQAAPEATFAGTLGFITAVLNLGGLAAFGVVMFFLYTRALREHKAQVEKITDAHQATITQIFKDHRDQLATERASGERHAAEARADCTEKHRESMQRFDRIEAEIKSFRTPRRP